MARSKRRDRKSSTKSKKHRPALPEEDEEEDEADNITHFKVEKIIDSKKTKNGTLYRVRWKGWSPADDTWEPIENVASTGHADRYVREVRARGLNSKTPGVAMIEYDDGERQLVDLRAEKFRAPTDDDDSVRDDAVVNDFSLIKKGGVIELLWPFVDIYFEARIVNWCPLSEEEMLKEVVEEKTCDDDSIKKPAEATKEPRKKKERHPEDTEESMSTKKSKRESRKSKSNINDTSGVMPEKPKAELRDEKKTSKLRLKDKAMLGTDDGVEEEHTPTRKVKKAVRSKQRTEEEVETNDMPEDMQNASPIQSKSKSSKRRRAGAESEPPKPFEIDSEDAIDTKSTKQPSESVADDHLKLTSIPKKRKLLPPHPLPEGAATMDSKPPPTKSRQQSLQIAESKPKRRGKRDKRSKTSPNKVPLNSKVHNGSMSEGSLSSASEEKNNKRTNPPTKASILSKVLKKISRKSRSIEEDEYLKSIQSDNDDDEPHSSEEEWSDKPPERVGQGVPLFNEPEDEFASDDDYESDIAEDNIRHAADGLDFEDMWKMKLEQTYETMLRNRGTFGVHNNNISN